LREVDISNIVRTQNKSRISFKTELLAMSKFTSQNINLHYEVIGTGTPVLFLHGFTVNFELNFLQSGWADRLAKRGFQVIGMDMRGHGKSDKPLLPTDYGTVNMANDAMALLKHLEIKQAHLIGYSMGSVIALHLLHQHPEKFLRACLIGTGDGLVGVPPYTFEAILPGFSALLSLTDFPAHLPPHVSAYWTLVHETGGNIEALIAASSADYPHVPIASANEISTPTQIISGENDNVLGTGKILASSLPNSEYLEIGDENHFTLAFSELAQLAVLDFFEKT
jgi:pimeloyl-ACP methyl ester carboxylesterase